MPNSASDWVTSLLTVGLIVLSGAYCVVSTLIARARRRHGAPVPGVYPGSPEQQAALEAAGVTSMAEWSRPYVVDQERADTAALDRAERAETGRVRPPRERLRQAPDVLADAEESARWAASRMAEAAQRNALFHP